MRLVRALSAATLVVDAEAVRAAVVDAAEIAAEIVTAAVADRAGSSNPMHERDVRHCGRLYSLVHHQCIIVAPPFFLGGRMSRMKGSIARNIMASSQKTSLNDMIAACCRMMFSTIPFAIR